VASLPELQSFRLVSADNPGRGVSPYDGNHPLNIDGVVEPMESLVTHLGLNRSGSSEAAWEAWSNCSMRNKIQVKSPAL